MISSKRAIGGRSNRPFVQGLNFVSSQRSVELRQWVLRNNQVSFTFTEDLLKGVRLSGWTHREFTEPFVNTSRSLWQINVIRDYIITRLSTIKYETYSLYPVIKNFVPPSTIPTNTTDGGSRFTFLWEDVAYDAKHPELKCDVYLYATLEEDSDALDMSVSFLAKQSYPDRLLSDFNSAIVTTVHLPRIALATKSDEDANENTVFSVPVAWGTTVANPNKYLRTPRHLYESFNYGHLNKRMYHSFNITNPVISLQRANFVSPGQMSIPAMVYGRRDTKEATLVYAMDRLGTNPKSFQWYCDDRNFHFVSYHVSDHEVDPYGIGGYDVTYSGPSEVNTNYSTSNTPAWSLRIRPYKAPTRWVDWYGFKIYKEEAVPEQVELGWLPDTFYDRYQNDEIKLESAEIPMIMNSFGYTTGDLSNAVRASHVYRDMYKQCVNPNLTGHVIIPLHTQNITFNYVPLSGSNTGNPSNSYWGWEQWSTTGIGLLVGPEPFKAPDFTVINNKYAIPYQHMISGGTLPYHYLAFPIVLTSGSTFVNIHSGIDLVGRGLLLEDSSTTNQQYRTYAYSGAIYEAASRTFWACFSSNVVKEQFGEIASAHADYGAGLYHDTLGVYGKGCFARSHTYYNTGAHTHTTYRHPRGHFTNYFNTKQVAWLDEWKQSAYDNISARWINGRGDSGFVMNQSSEWPTDMQLKYIPISLANGWSITNDAYLNFFTSGIRPDAINNYFAGIQIDNLDDATLGPIVAGAGVTSWQCFVEPPNWFQLCPGFQIAHSDRVIMNDWASIYASNAYNAFYSGGQVTGVGTYGQQFKGNATEERQKLDWTSYSVLQWPITNRMSVWHAESDFQIFNTGYATIEEDERLIFYSGIWSGYTQNLVKKLFRIQAYNPDYIYHGTMEHPLESWSTTKGTENASVRHLKRAQYPNLESITGVYIGTEKIAHTVRRHRDNDNLLIIIGNWHSGTANFTATFEPAAYDIHNGYQVYDLDVSSAEHGTRTLETIKEPQSSFSISLSLAQYGYKVYEINVNDSTLDATAFSDLRTDYTPIRYSYSVLQVLSNSNNFAYSYGSSIFGELIRPLEGYRAPSTQQILNNLPQWMKLRQSNESTGWKLTNSWGMAFDNLIENTIKSISDMNLVTVDSTYLSRLNYTEITSRELLEPRQPRNILFNSAFSLRDVSRTNLPAGWEQFDNNPSVFLDYRTSTISPCSITSSSGVLKIGQQVVLNNPSISKLYASIYVLCNASTVDVKLHIAVEKIDGTTTSSTAIIDSRSTEWIRLVLPLDINAQVFRVSYSVHGNCSGTVSVTAPQLEISSLSKWGKSTAESTDPFNSVYSLSLEPFPKKTPVFGIPDEKTFLEIGIPTRVTRLTKPSRNLAPYTTQAFGRKVTQLGEVVRTQFTVFEEQIVERSIDTTAWDIYGRYDIRDLRFFEELDFGTREDPSVVITPLATAIRGNWMFVACKEEYIGNTIRTLKIMRPRTPPNGETYLESLTDFDLDLNFDTMYAEDQITDEEIFSIGFSDVDPKFMIVTTTNNIKHYYRLYFDYYYFNQTKNRLYTLEAYENAKLIVI